MSAGRWALAGVGAAAIAGGVAAAVAATNAEKHGDDEYDGRWRVVTIDRPRSEVVTGETPPVPLDRFGDELEWEAVDAPGDWGTELRARLRHEPHGHALGQRAAGTDPRQSLRAALREAKQLIEVGEVMRLDPQPAGHRPATPAGILTDLLSKRAGGEGVL